MLLADDERMKPIVETFLLTELRRGELIHLTWADIDFENKILSVQAKGDWQPKDYETRHIPMTPRLAELLQKHQRKEDSFVFVSRQGQPVDPDVLSHDFLKLVRSRGIKGASIHTLRHSFASHLIMSGSDLYTVQKLLGHPSIKTTGIYAHLAPDDLKAAMQRLTF